MYVPFCSLKRYSNYEISAFVFMDFTNGEVELEDPIKFPLHVGKCMWLDCVGKALLLTVSSKLKLWLARTHF